MTERLNAADWAVIGGLVAKEYQNARRAQLRASTPIANEKAVVRVEMIGRLLHLIANPYGEPVAYLDLEKIEHGMAYATRMKTNHRQTALYPGVPKP